MERAFFITNYRNIGITDKQEAAQRLVLNRFLDTNKIGDLVIIIGQNNSGKSNILKALESFDKKTIDRSNCTTLYFDEKYQTPQLSLCCKGNENEEYTMRITYKSNQIFTHYPKCNDYNLNINDLQVLTDGLKEFLPYYSSLYNKNNYYININNIKNLLNELSKLEAVKENTNIFNEYLNVTIRFFKNLYTSYPSIFENFIKNCKNNKFRNFVKFSINKDDNTTLINNEFNDKYGIKFTPKIYTYDKKTFSNRDLISDPSNISENIFFVTLFDIINYSVKNLYTVYEKCNQRNALGYLKQEENRINSKLNKVSNIFNKLYCFNNSNYKFNISLNPSSIYFSIFDGNNALSLEDQSTGFRWFFDLFFNLLSKNTLYKGDIILMDEPGVHLHVQGQKELRKFLKEFAINNGITIVMVTHSPFLIDIDYLDEIRVVEKTEDGGITIHNDFSAIENNNNDTLASLKRGLTVPSCDLLDPDKNVVFVEGITDYNYLTAFKNLLKIDDNIIFLPINGIGKANDEKLQKQIAKNLINLKKHNPKLLVDSDKAGKAMKKLNSEHSSLEVIELQDIDSNFKTIESLFDIKDLEKFHLIDKAGKFVKSSGLSSNLKTNIAKCEFSESTKANFKKLFEKLTQD